MRSIIEKVGREITGRWRVVAVKTAMGPAYLGTRDRVYEGVEPGPWIDPDAMYLVVNTADLKAISVSASEAKDVPVEYLWIRVRGTYGQPDEVVKVTGVEPTKIATSPAVKFTYEKTAFLPCGFSAFLDDDYMSPSMTLEVRYP